MYCLCTSNFLFFILFIEAIFLFLLSTSHPHFQPQCMCLSKRLETPLLRRFCSAGGYGWDYPDSEYRDIPLCFPEFLCRRLLRILLTDHNFRLSPAGKKPLIRSLSSHTFYFLSDHSSVYLCRCLTHLEFTPDLLNPQFHHIEKSEVLILQ